MGVKIEDTYPSILNANGITSYNLGVQGYSVTQMLGTLKKFGLELKPRYIIVAYSEGIYKREKNFLKKDTLRYPGGIGVIASNELNELRKEAKFIFSGLWLITKRMRYEMRDSLKYFLENKKILIKEKQFKLYKTSILKTEEYNSEPVIKKSWETTLETFKEMSNLAKKNDAKLIILYIPSRNVVYYERATSKKIPNAALAESKLLANFANQNNITFINPYNDLLKYVDNLPKDFQIKSLPFLEIDAHMNKLGYQIISNKILNFLKKVEK